MPYVQGQPDAVADVALAYNLGNFLRRLALPRDVKHWSLTTLWEKFIKIVAKATRQAKYVTFQLAEVAVTRTCSRRFSPTSRGWQSRRRRSHDVTVEQIKERTTRPVTEKVCADPAFDAGKRSGWPLSQLTAPPEPDRQ